MENASCGSGLHPDRGIPGWRRHSDGSERRDTRSKTSLGTIEISSEHSAVPGRSELPTNSDRDARLSVLIRPDLPEPDLWSAIVSLAAGRSEHAPDRLLPDIAKLGWRSLKACPWTRSTSSCC